MCGICGLVTLDRSELPTAGQVEAASGLLQHRGPDGSGVYLSPEGEGPHAALGHRRLSIIDLEGGRQPMTNEDGSVWITFNGEIYNFLELRHDLEARGHRFQTRSDTEVILHAYESYGEECVRRLRGMFAFALWDNRSKRLLLARDRLGQKPLFYCRLGDLLAFASQPGPLFALCPIERRLDPRALDAYLAYQYVPHPLSIYEGIQKLPPAHYLVYENRQVRLEGYWQLDLERRETLSEDDACLRLREALRESVRLRLVSDVPIGAFLSGGIDSTIIVGLMAQEMDRPVETFTIGFDEPEYNEIEFARTVSRRFSTAHHELFVRPQALEILPQIAECFDEPFADSSAIPTYYLSRLTRQSVKVALTGDAGDENFAGYDRYKAVRLARILDRVPVARSLLGLGLWQRCPVPAHARSTFRRVQRLLDGIALPERRRYFRWISILSDRTRQHLYTPAFRDRVAAFDPCELLDRHFARAEGLDPVAAATYVDLCTYLPDDLLVKVDVTSMAHSLEARSPFLDHPFVELAASLPVRYKLRGFQDKYILKRAFADLFPETVRRRRKMGFGVPLARWFRHEVRELLRDRLLDGWATRQGILQPRGIQRLVQEHLEERRDHSHALWSLLMLELWAVRQPSAVML
ncbi:MAG: asparagine synthase (glutamine-hydrolyzing) [Planctomycetes bacterium]|nr:asparagine synthase (glutamine-hydrolyzing) [Planctomycetota bacterium]